MSSIDDFVKAKGRLQVVLRDEFGNIKEEHEFDNLVVTVGKNHIASRLSASPATVMGWMAVGTGSTAAAAGDTTLVSEVAASRTALTSFSASSNVVTAVCTFNPGTGTGALQEAGIFNASSAGTMLCRTVFSVINKGAADTLTINWTITIS